MARTTPAPKARRRRAAFAVLASGALVAGVPAAAYAHGGSNNNDHNNGDHRSKVTTVVDGLSGPRGIAESYGRLVVTETDGTFSLVVPGNRYHHNDNGQAKLIKLGKLNTEFSPAVDIGRHGTVWLLTGAGAPGTGAATLYKWQKGYSAPKAVADIAAYQKTDPDPYDLEKKPTDSNPFGVAALKDGSVLVADAGGNDLLRVKPDGSISTVARLKPRTVAVPPGLGKELPSEEPGQPPIKIPPAGTKVPSEAVATSITVGPDGYWYVGELRGFPATHGTSQIWRIKPGTTNATCDPKHPQKGDCKRYADGLTSIMDLGARPGGDAIYAVEMSRLSWLKAEMQKPGSQYGKLVKVYSDGSHSGNLAKGKLMLPGGVAVDEHGNAYVAGPVFGPGSVQKVSSGYGHDHNYNHHDNNYDHHHGHHNNHHNNN